MLKVKINKNNLVRDIMDKVSNVDISRKQVITHSLDLINSNIRVSSALGYIGEEYSNTLIKQRKLIKELEQIKRKERLLLLIGMVTRQEGDVFELDEDVYSFIYNET